MSEVATVETAAMERQEYMDTRPQDRYSGRLKFACCRRCGSTDGMQAVHQETLTEAPAPVLWYKRLDETEYLFYPCPRCNRWCTVPSGYMHISVNDIVDWLDRNPMEPDYAALAAEPEAATAGQDSRESAGL